MFIAGLRPFLHLLGDKGALLEGLGLAQRTQRGRPIRYLAGFIKRLGGAGAMFKAAQFGWLIRGLTMIGDFNCKWDFACEHPNFLNNDLALFQCVTCGLHCECETTELGTEVDEDGRECCVPFR
jgi:hypothetical protein